MSFRLCRYNSARPASEAGLRCCLLVAGLMLLAAGACAPRPPELEPAELPPRVVIKQLEKRQRRFSSFRAVASVDFESVKEHWSGKVFIIGRVPQSYRLELVGLFGRPLLYLVSDGKQFVTWVPGSKEAYQGAATGNTLAAVVDFPLKDQEAVVLLAGIIPRWRYRRARLLRERSSHALVLIFEDDLGRESHRVWLDSQGLRITRIEQLHEGRLLMLARYQDYAVTKEGFYPKRLEFQGNGVRLSLHYQQFAVNEPLKKDAFRLALPRGVVLLPW